MVDNPAWEICERLAEVQTLPHDHIECGKHSAADLVAMARAVLSEPKLLRAIFDAYLPLTVDKCSANCRFSFIQSTGG